MRLQQKLCRVARGAFLSRPQATRVVARAPASHSNRVRAATQTCQSIARPGRARFQLASMTTFVGRVCKAQSFCPTGRRGACCSRWGSSTACSQGHLCGGSCSPVSVFACQLPLRMKPILSEYLRFFLMMALTLVPYAQTFF